MNVGSQGATYKVIKSAPVVKLVPTLVHVQHQLPELPPWPCPCLSLSARAALSTPRGWTRSCAPLSMRRTRSSSTIVSLRVEYQRWGWSKNKQYIVFVKKFVMISVLFQFGILSDICMHGSMHGNVPISRVQQLKVALRLVSRVRLTGPPARHFTCTCTIRDPDRSSTHWQCRWGG